MRKIIVLITIFNLSCSKEFYFQKDQVKISNDLKQIVATDQSVRNNLTGIQTRYNIKSFETILDSISRFGDLKNGYDFSKLLSEEKQIEKFTDEIKKDYILEVTRGKILIDYIDSLNQKKLLNIIKKYGYPSYYNRKWKSHDLQIGVTFVLTHMDVNSKIGKQYFDVLMKEYEKGRFDEGSMRHYLWHFNYRQGMIDHNGNIDTLVIKAKKIRKQRDLIAEQKPVTSR